MFQTSPITRTEYTQAREIASRALLSRNTGNPLLARKANEDAHALRTSRTDRSPTAEFALVALCHATRLMGRPDESRASEARSELFASLNQAVKEAKGARKS